MYLAYIYGSSKFNVRCSLEQLGKKI